MLTVPDIIAHSIPLWIPTTAHLVAVVVEQVERHLPQGLHAPGPHHPLHAPHAVLVAQLLHPQHLAVADDGGVLDARLPGHLGVRAQEGVLPMHRQEVLGPDQPDQLLQLVPVVKMQAQRDALFVCRIQLILASRPLPILEMGRGGGGHQGNTNVAGASPGCSAPPLFSMMEGEKCETDRHAILVVWREHISMFLGIAEPEVPADMPAGRAGVWVGGWS